MSLFTDLKALSERFAISSDVAVVGRASVAWELSLKTHLHVHTVLESQSNLYIIEQQLLK